MLKQHQFSLFSLLPGFAVIKDLNSRFLGVTHELARMVGWKSADEAISSTDYDIPCHVSEFASEFIALDQKAIKSQQKLVTFDIQPYICGWRLIIVERNPIQDENGKSIALFSKGIDVTEVDLFKKYLALHRRDEKLVGKNLKATSYILDQHHLSLSITDKQANCLFLLIRGKTVKEIAKILKVSPRTIESHLEAIKLRLNCQYKSEMLEKAIDSGFFYYIPKYFQNTKLEEIIS